MRDTLDNELTMAEVINTQGSYVPLVMKFLRNEPMEAREIIFCLTKMTPQMFLAIAIANGIRSVKFE